MVWAKTSYRSVYLHVVRFTLNDSSKHIIITNRAHSKKRYTTRRETRPVENLFDIFFFRRRTRSKIPLRALQNINISIIRVIRLL